MNKFNFNQKKLIANGIMSLSVAYVSITTITPIIYQFKFEMKILLLIFTVVIISLLMSIYAISLLKK